MTDLATPAPTMRRALLTDSGEPLYAPCAPVVSAIRFAAFAEATGLDPASLLTSPLVSVPLPLYPSTWPEGRRRWGEVRPEAMWHPLLWLPARVALPATIQSVDGSERLETPDEWALRVAIELSTVGLYDEGTGTWMDVLAMVGLDVDDELDLARVEEWLDGASDDLLDAIDLADILDIETDHDWAVHEVHAGIETMWTVAYASSAGDLLDLADSIREAIASGEIDREEAVRATARIGLLAASTFWRIGDATIEGGEQPPDLLWDWDPLVERVRGFEGTVEEFDAGLLDEVFDRLELIEGIYLPTVNEMAGELDDADTYEGGGEDG